MANVAKSNVETPTLMWQMPPGYSTSTVIDMRTDGHKLECADDSDVVPMDKISDAIGLMVNSQSFLGVAIKSC